MSIQDTSRLQILSSALFLTAALTMYHCGGGDWVPPSFNAPSFERYSCACTCDYYDASAIGTPKKSISYVKHSSKATVCAKNANWAKLYCPQACKEYIDDTLNNSSVTISNCQVTPVDPVKPMNEYCTSNSSALIGARPTHATLDGPIDFGRSTLEVFLTGGDHAKVNLKGEISLVGGNYAGPVEVWHLKLEPVNPTFDTDENYTIKDLVAMNEGVWDGSMSTGGSFSLATSSKLSVAAVVEGTSGISDLSPSSLVAGKILPMYRPHTTGSTLTNALIIDGQFQDTNVRAVIHLHVWLADCRPTINAQADCWGGIDSSGKFLKLGESFGLLGNLQGQDLCNATRTENPAKCYTSSGEFPKFYCDKVYLPPPSNQAAVKSQLKFRWTDATGIEISKLADDILGYMPSFPLTLQVENEWGRSASYTFPSAPQGSNCPAPLYRVAWPQEGILDAPLKSFVTEVHPKGWYSFSLSSSPDAELLVRVGAEPNRDQYDCMSGGLAEPCEVALEDENDIHLRISSPELGVPFLLQSDWLGFAEEGVVVPGQEIRYRTPVLPPGDYRFDIVGMGDADLYVGADFEPTEDEFDCRPQSPDSNESCILVLHEPAEIHAMVRGRAPESNFEVTASPF